jgi:hypothetical protein
MIEFIYFSQLAVGRFDPQFRTKRFHHADWFNLQWPGCAHINSRVHQLNTPWNLANSLFSMPVQMPSSSFSQTIESIADRFCKHVIASSLTPYLFWSGGIDSTVILVSLLKVANKDFLDRLTILHDNSSIEENSYFYNRYIDQKLKTLQIDDFKITENNYKEIIIVDGEGGNQCLGGHSIHQMCHLKQFDLLDQPWSSVDFESMQPVISRFNLELIQKSIKLAPIEINTLYDFIWWSNFNFKFDDIMIRKMFVYGKNLLPSQREHLWNYGLYRFFAQPEIQNWSMSNLQQRRETARLDPKYTAKKYIYDFDHNHLWFAYKKEQGSVPSLFDLQTLPMIGITPDWNYVSIADPGVRLQLKQILDHNRTD